MHLQSAFLENTCQGLKDASKSRRKHSLESRKKCDVLQQTWNKGFILKKEQLVEQSKYDIMRYLSKNTQLLLGTSQLSFIGYQLQIPFSL